MYDPQIPKGTSMFVDMFNKHAFELYMGEYYYEKIKYDDGFEQIVPRVYFEMKR